MRTTNMNINIEDLKRQLDSEARREVLELKETIERLREHNRSQASYIDRLKEQCRDNNLEIHALQDELNKQLEKRYFKAN